MIFTEKYSKISKKLIKADISKYSENFAIQITMDDEDCGGTFFVKFMDGAFMVEPYDYVDNTVNINIMAATLDKLVDKKLDVYEAFEKGLIRANGNTNHLAMLFEGFEKKVRKPATKKTVVKAETKKTVKKPKKADSESAKKTENKTKKK